MIQSLADEEGDGWKIPPLAPDGESLGVSNQDDVEWLRSKMTAHPIRTLEGAAHLENPAANNIPRTYIFCTGNPPDGTFPRIANQIKHDENWNYMELSSPHAAMISSAEALAGAILQAIKK